MPVTCLIVVMRKKALVMDLVLIKYHTMRILHIEHVMSA